MTRVFQRAVPRQGRQTDNRNTKMAVLTILFPRTHFVPRIFFFFTVYLVVVSLWDKLLKWSSCWIKTWSTPASAFKVLYTVTDVCLISVNLYTIESCVVQCLNFVVFSKIYIVLFYLCEYVCGEETIEARKCVRSLKLEGYRKFWASQCGCWELNLGPGRTANNNRWIISLVSNFVGFLENKKQKC